MKLKINGSFDVMKPNTHKIFKKIFFIVCTKNGPINTKSHMYLTKMQHTLEQFPKFKNLRNDK